MMTVYATKRHFFLYQNKYSYMLHWGGMCRRDSTACMQQPALSRRLYFQSGLEQGLNLGVGLLECALDILFAKEYLVERPCHNLADFN